MGRIRGVGFITGLVVMDIRLDYFSIIIMRSICVHILCARTSSRRYVPYSWQFGNGYYFVEEVFCFTHTIHIEQKVFRRASSSVGSVSQSGRGILSMLALSHGVVRVEQENKLNSLTLQVRIIKD